MARPEASPDVYEDLALAYLDMGMREDALKTLAEGLRQFPGHPGLRKALDAIEDRGDEPERSGKG